LSSRVIFIDYGKCLPGTFIADRREHFSFIQKFVLPNSFWTEAIDKEFVGFAGLVL
jgi:hypothetical protein